MMFRPRSDGVRATVSRTLQAEAQMLACVSGTIFGRDVVPEVCRISATFTGLGYPSSRWHSRHAVMPLQVYGASALGAGDEFDHGDASAERYPDGG